MVTNDNMIERYISNQPSKTQKALREIWEYIKAAAPDAEETINYQIPAFTLIKGGKREQQIMIAGYKNHIGFYPHPTTIEKFQKELSLYKSAKGSVQFPLDSPIPKELIIKMVKFRLKEVSK